MMMNQNYNRDNNNNNEPIIVWLDGYSIYKDGI